MRDPKTLRSQQWFAGGEYENLARRAALRSEGFGPQVFDGKPVIGICNSWSELTNCNVHLRQVAEAVKRGVWAAGGVPLEFPTISLGELFMKPTTMLFRNLMSMDVGRVDHRQPDRWRRSARRMRQDDPRAVDGRGQRRPAGHHGDGRPDAERALGDPCVGLGHGRTQAFRGASRGPHHRRANLRGRKLHLTQRRPLHRNGHGPRPWHRWRKPLE